MKHEEEKIIYTCPMHPEVQKDGYDKHAGHSTQMFARKFWVSLVLTIPVILYSELPNQLFEYKAPAFFGSQYLTLVLGSIVFFYSGWVFIIGAYHELKARLPGMMTLIGLAIFTAYIYSVFGALLKTGHDLFWELTTLITVMLLGHFIEMKAVNSAQSALKELSKLLPDTAELIRGDKTEIVSLEEIREGDTVLVRPGGKVPADGVVVSGKSETNESMITGESKPVTKIVGDGVIAGTINGDGALKIKVSKIGENTFLAGVMRLVREAQASKSRLQVLSDRAAFYLTIIAVGGGILTFIAWFIARAGFSFAIERLVTVLVIACPHALGLAIPLVAAISTTLAAKNGLLVRQRLALEAARKINVVLFDKTGTLTKGEFGLVNAEGFNDSSEDEVIRLAASVDARSEHPISKSIVKAAQEKNLSLFEVKDFTRLSGMGVSGIINGEKIFVGGPALLSKLNIKLSKDYENIVREENKKGRTVIFVIKEKLIIGVCSHADLIREESREAVDALKAMGIKTAMITGDSEDVAKWVAGELNIDEYFARVLPQEKAAKVKMLQSKGLEVAMVGDGINDAPALTQADLGIAIGAGTNVAIESAGIILVRSDPRDIVKIIKLSRLTYRKMLQNLFWATSYNLVALPLAAGVLAPYGILLQPAVGAVFMSLSTVIVAFNAILLRNNKL